jgi:hypothetical protein
MMTEDRLRDLLRDPGWSLPAWPDAQARVRRAARRQRLTIASVGAAVVAVVTMAAAVPVAVLRDNPAGPPGGPGPGGPPAATASRGLIQTLALPAVGARGFSVKIYPAPVQARVLTPVLAKCPAPAGLRAPGSNTAAAALTALRRLGHGFTTDLRLSDRALWPQVAAGWRVNAPVWEIRPVVGTGTFVIRAGRPAFRVSRPEASAGRTVLYSGPLQSWRQAPRPPGASGPIHGPPAAMHIQAVQRVVAAGCGVHLVHDTWVIVSGRATSPALEAKTLFLNRRGHILVYNSE